MKFPSIPDELRAASARPSAAPNAETTPAARLLSGPALATDTRRRHPEDHPLPSWSGSRSAHRFGALEIFVLSAVASFGCQGSGGAHEPGILNGDGGAPGVDTGSIDSGTLEGRDGSVLATCPIGHPMSRLSGKPVVMVALSGIGPFPFMYDTGAPTSAIEEATYEAVGPGPYEVEVGGRSAEVGSMTRFSAERLGIDGVAGILGTDIMGRFAVTLDFSREVFWLDDARDEAALTACEHVRREPVEVPYLLANYLFVSGHAEGLEGRFLVDTGASLGAMPNTIFDRLQEASERPALEGFYTPAAIGTFWARLTAIGSLEVAGQRVEHILTRTVADDLIPVPDFDGEPFLGVLPSGFLHHFLMTVDHPNNVVRLDPYAASAMREPSSIFVAGIGLGRNEQPPIRVAQVLAGSAAAEAGVQIGDEVVEIEGRPVGDLEPYARPFMLAAQVEGTEVSVRLRRTVEGADPLELDFILETRDLLIDPESR